MSILDNLPVSTLLAIAAVVGGIIALANGSIDYQQFLIGIGASTAGIGVLGKARADSGKSTK